ncbi:hypothetical protein HDU96_009450 [Phlyctochytrium bullatum]|nr:hypothetical protein HDU96_009450 [Phlyctochytrium bullatum]
MYSTEHFDDRYDHILHLLNAEENDDATNEALLQYMDFLADSPSTFQIIKYLARNPIPNLRPPSDEPLEYIRNGQIAEVQDDIDLGCGQTSDGCSQPTSQPPHVDHHGYVQIHQQQNANTHHQPCSYMYQQQYAQYYQPCGYMCQQQQFQYASYTSSVGQVPMQPSVNYGTYFFIVSAYQVPVAAA